MSDANAKPAEQPGPESGVEALPASESQGDVYLDQLSSKSDDLSVEEIDSFLQVQDPAFAGHLKTIQKDSNLSMAESEVDAATAELHDEIEKWRQSRGLKRLIYAFVPFAPRVSLALKKARVRVLIWVRAARLYVQNFIYYLLHEGRRSAQAWSKAKISSIVQGIGTALADFKKLSLKLKLAVFGMVLLVAGSAFVLTLAWKGKLIPPEPELFVTNLANHATQVYEVKDEDGFENFYDNIRSTPNLLLIQKLVVNIKASTNSGRNPMMAGEFFVEGLNPDVIIEVKDREPYFRDLIQRTTEDFDFDELSTPEGKRHYLDVLLREINRQLTTGELRNIRIKTFILKP